MQNFLQICFMSVLCYALCSCSTVVNKEVADPSIVTNQATYNELNGEIEKWMKKHHVAGLAASIVKGDRVVWSKGYGWANIEKQIPFSPDNTIFQIASVTKTVTATAIMQLVEHGKIQLDCDINDYLPFSVRNPAYPEVPITVKQLLTHTSSIHDTDAVYDCYSPGDPTVSIREFVEGYLVPGGAYWNKKNYRRRFRPGEKEEYSNAGFALLGYLVEAVSGNSIEEYVQKNILKPLQMERTSFYLANIDKEKHAIPYTYVSKVRPGRKITDVGDGFLLPEGAKVKQGYNAHVLYSYPTLTDGLIRTSVNQLAHFLIAYINNGSYAGKEILQPATVKDMLTIHAGKEQGLCWFKTGDAWGHNGGDPGVSTEMRFIPESGIGVIVFCNADVELEPIVKKLLKKSPPVQPTVEVFR